MKILSVTYVCDKCGRSLPVRAGAFAYEAKDLAKKSGWHIFRDEYQVEKHQCSVCGGV